MSTNDIHEITID